jgi:hypothetical protein
MIGNCDACDRQNVPVSNCRSSSGESVQCFLCQGDSNPDPYGELPGAVPSPLEAAKKLLIFAAVGSCTCNTKTPELMWHAPDCRFATLMMALENVEIALEAASPVSSQERTSP